MILNILILFFITFFAGILIIYYPELNKKNFKYMLTFSGAYLFSITVLHILPELFMVTNSHIYIGLFVLLGFYFQIIIDYFSQGVEHGHSHHNHSNGSKGIYMLFISLFIHSLLEGTLLVHPHATHEHDEVRHLLFGLMLHKIPESFALAAVLIIAIQQKKWVIILIFIYALASPIGLALSNIVSINNFYSSKLFSYLFAFVAGNFLHISTTIFFESESKDHQFKAAKMITMVLAGILAILIEVVV
ncbi:MAG: zinc permease [Cytophagales bacterium]|nr:MAG: zinc permease [Cytophagales bacterium]